MTLRSIIETYPERYVVLVPLLRDALTDKPLTYEVLEECISIEDGMKVQEYYEGKGLSGVILFPTFEGDIPLEPEDAARMFRVLMGGI